MQTVEQLAETVNSLPSADRDRFFDLVETIEVAEGPTNGTAQQSETEEFHARFRKSQQWIRENKEEFDGQWVCLFGDQLVSHGMDGMKVFNEARAKGIEAPFIERINAHELPFGGW